MNAAMSEDDRLASETEGAAVETEEAAPKLQFSVEVEKTGACSRHVRVRIPREEVDRLYGEELKGFTSEASIPGFRPGHVPSKLVERRFKKELGDQVKQRLMVESLEGASENHQLDPINEPDLDVKSLEIPETGDFEYEFDVEVRPEFDLPDFTTLEVERQIATASDAEVERRINLLREEIATIDESTEPARPGDLLTLAVLFEHAGKGLFKIPELVVSLKRRLRFHDAELAGWDQLMTGVVPGDVREADLVVSSEAETLHMRGETVKARFQVTAVHRVQLPEIDREFLDRFDVEDVDELRTRIREMIDRQLAFQVRQAARRQVLAKILDAGNWELPEKMVLKQVENALRREMLEMQQAGYSKREIANREGEIRQRAVSNTRQALKEHFVLDKVANDNKIEPTPNDLETEIFNMSLQAGESPRRLRARLEKSGLIENLEAQVRERMAVDFILDRVRYVDKAVVADAASESGDVEPVQYSICGEVAGTSVANEAADEE